MQLDKYEKWLEMQGHDTNQFLQMNHPPVCPVNMRSKNNQKD